ncbi:Protein kinase C-binding protein nell1, partial [Ilyodon furcidens]
MTAGYSFGAYLEIVPKDEPDLLRSTILLLISSLNSFHCPMISQKEVMCLMCCPKKHPPGVPPFNSILDGQTFCRRRPCDCSDPDEDLFCCPSCDNRPTSQCLDQSGRTLYRSGASWLYGCQQCRCMEGEVDCWPLVCPVLLCEYTAVAEGECCPRCVTDPCLADNLSYDIRQACTDPTGVTRLSGDTWHMPQSPCTTCKCK